MIKMNQDIRSSLISRVKRVVVKIGSNVLSHPDLTLDYSIFENLSSDISNAIDEGFKMVVVSSGAILAGMAKLEIKNRPRLIKQKQAVAAVGQSTLMNTYEKYFERFEKRVAQILLTDDDMSDRKRYINARNTIETLFCLDVLPIVNENDTVAIDEIKLGDNDTLSSVVSQMIEADLLIILSDIDGLYSADPNRFSDARFIPIVKNIDKSIYELAKESYTSIGTGGMLTKIKAAQGAVKSGTSTIIVNGRINGVVSRILKGEELGTLFIAEEEVLSSRKSWIAFTLKPRGSLIVDEGAYKALTENNKSLLASGIKKVNGAFDPGDPVSLLSPDGIEFARGLVNYSAEEIDRIKGIKSSFIEQILGYCISDEIIHRDNLAVIVPRVNGCV